eukprot:GILJ01002805.1.p1 GENE.GILJ01002805.1~~GILJ01002805.1.p1  ORF type:complete len:249 (+),score=22.02 GILJ01002805.1:82-747(+)
MPSNLWAAPVSPSPRYSAYSYEQMALQNEQLMLLQLIAEQNATADLVYRLSSTLPGSNFCKLDHSNESPSFSQLRLPPLQSSFLSDPILRKDIIKPKVQRAFPSASTFYQQDTSCDSSSGCESSQSSSSSCFSDSRSKITVRARCPNSPKKNNTAKRVWTRIPANPACAVCATTSTPRWRLGANNARVCNACGLFYRKTQVSDGGKKLKLKAKPQGDLYKF